MKDKDKLKNLKEIYSQQHYFIDRHDSMSEKYISILTFIATALTVLFTLNSDKIRSYKSLFILSFGFLFFFLIVAIVKVIFIFNPLSEYFIRKSSTSENRKDYIMKSYIYYRGIINRIDYEGSARYVENINEQNLIEDITNQIYVLANYNEVKRKRLDKAKIWILITVLIALINVFLILWINLIG
ncbi:Uncharacterised protein [[Clostridium] sordellii]|uniref:hypothetical protein n=1 Tax=Paraclostridium sordellii TaxID=1505 RepID=UPI0005E6E804|nr:hypothetical protein [Paeniclostridium sordellii]CEQ10375.1 Uncharacterised protein [[Clostridium] sordellii] [Paeniclostridium sordellii]